MFLVKLGAKRQIKYLLSTEEFKGNLSLTSESSTHKTPHPDTLGNLLKKLSPKELPKIRHKIIARLIRHEMPGAFPPVGSVLHDSNRR